MTTYFVRAALCAVLLLGSQAVVALAQAQPTGLFDVPPVPPDVDVPAGHSLFLAGHAIGTQNFICVGTNDRMEWRFTGPQATLFLRIARRLWQVTTHFLSANPAEGGLPRQTWQHSLDTSAVWGRVRASSADPEYVEPGATPGCFSRSRARGSARQAAGC